MKISKTRFLACVVLGSVGLCGCGISGFVKSELSAYEEPAEGELAHIRLIGSRNVKVYPDSTCVQPLLPGSGYPAGPQMGGQRKRDIGMPKADPMPDHYIEIAARAGRPITATFSFHGEMSMPGMVGTGAPGSRATSGCRAAASFIPEAGAHYELATKWSFGQDCKLELRQIVTDGEGRTRRVPVAAQPASSCKAGNAE